ncbi:hypothetical protein [Mycobacterium hubeiense]|uniref:hypothetical protein n=1 Tax=Mycobacterium hubeiense TaxID=1867256 RepID=UPI001E4A0931|nr:hypothetical protein [Mycobacterium sp. QGD 101]
MLAQAAQADDAAQALQRRAQRLEEFAAHRAQLGAIDLTSTAEAVCAPRGLRQHRHHRWADHQVSIGFSDVDPGYQLRVVFGARRSQLWSAMLPPKVRRRGAEVVRAWAEEVVAGWLQGLDAEIATTHGHAETAGQRAAAARAAAGAADTSEPDDLVAARRELAEVDKAIQAELGGPAAGETAA